MALSQKSRAAADVCNKQLEHLMPALTPLGIVMGFLLPGIFIQLRPMVAALFGMITFSGALNLRTGAFVQCMRRPLPILPAFISMHIIMPLAAFGVSSLFFPGDADTVTGFILLYSGPAAVSGLLWVTLFRGDAALCLTLLFLDTLLAPLVTPATLLALMGTRTAMHTGGIARSLCVMVVLPAAAGVTVNEASRGKVPALIGPYLAPLSKLCLPLIIAANASPVVPKARFGEPKVWAVAALGILLSATGYLFANLGGLAGRLPPEKRIALFFTGGLRNISAVTSIAVEFFPEAAALPALLGIVFQQSLAALMGRLFMGARHRR
ncbi:MAG: bile acid:sodium symporter [Treponema sp.]|jgi:predicted Na+-dependent transporter|nr:bile acid:sodium symporter [Treponema sp.]